MRVRLLCVCAVLLSCTGCAPGWLHYTAADGRDGWSYDRPDGSTVWAVLFDEGHPTLVDCTLVDC